MVPWTNKVSTCRKALYQNVCQNHFSMSCTVFWSIQYKRTNREKWVYIVDIYIVLCILYYIYIAEVSAIRPGSTVRFLWALYPRKYINYSFETNYIFKLIKFLDQLTEPSEHEVYPNSKNFKHIFNKLTLWVLYLRNYLTWNLIKKEKSCPHLWSSTYQVLRLIAICPSNLRHTCRNGIYVYCDWAYLISHRHR